MSPTQRSLALLRKDGWTCQVVEHWNAFARQRLDLFGVIDIIAVHPDRLGVLGVQCTTAANLSSRVKKAHDEPRLSVWIGSGNHFQVWGWGKTGERGRRKTWTVRKVSL